MRTAWLQTSGEHFFGMIESFHQKENDIKPGLLHGDFFFPVYFTRIRTCSAGTVGMVQRGAISTLYLQRSG